MEENEANEYEQMQKESASLRRRKREGGRGQNHRTVVKKEETRWREGVRTHVFMYMGVGSNLEARAYQCSRAWVRIVMP